MTISSIIDGFYEIIELPSTDYILDILDPIKCPVEALPALAVEFGAITYSDNLIGETYDRLAVSHAKQFQDLSLIHI